MASEWKQRSTVRTGGRIEVIVPELAPGEVVEVSVRWGAAPTPRTKRPVGLLEGKIRLADDFDAPLEEFKHHAS